MTKRGRRSAAALALVPANIEAIPRQPPPAELTPNQAEVWRAVIASQPADWFNGSTRLLLAQYCRHSVEARNLANEIAILRMTMADAAAKSDDPLTIMLSCTEAIDARLKMQEHVSRAMASIATKLRIT